MGIRIDYDCAYSLICNLMMWHVGFGGVKLCFYITSLLNLISRIKDNIMRLNWI